MFERTVWPYKRGWKVASAISWDVVFQSATWGEGRSEILLHGSIIFCNNDRPPVGECPLTLKIAARECFRIRGCFL